MRERDPHPVSAREVLDRPGEIRLAEAEPRENAFGLMLRILVPMGRVQRRLSRDGLELLGQVAHAQAGTLPDRPFVGGFLAQNHLEQRRLAGAVRPDEPDARMRPQMRRGIVEQDFRRKLLVD